MILLQTTLSIPVLELIAPAERRIVVQALVRLPELGERDWAVAKVLSENLLEGTRDFTRFAILIEGSAAGSSPRVTLMPDHLRVQLVFPAGQLTSAANMLRSILREPTLARSSIEKTLGLMPYRRRDLWDLTLFPWKPNFTRVRHEDVTEFYQRHVTPLNVLISVGGALEPGEAQKAFGSLWQGYATPRLLRPLPDRAALPEGSWSGRASSFDLIGAPFSGRAADLPTRLLALFALGVGKGSSMFKVLREGEGLSYQQQALLWPHPSGFQSRLIMIRRTSGEDDGEKMRKLLLGAVEGWGEVDRQRALGVAEGALARSAAWHPFAFTPSGLIGSSLEDDVFRQGYWKLKTGEEYNADSLLRSMERVKLGDLKNSAKELLSTAVVRSVRGTS